MNSPLVIPYKSIEALKLEQIKLAFMEHIISETSFSKYLEDVRYSNFFIDVLGYVSRNILPLYGYETIFLYLISSEKLSNTHASVIIDAFPTDVEAGKTLEFFKLEEERFMNVNHLPDLAPEHKRDLYNCLIIFIESVYNSLFSINGLDLVRGAVESDTNEILFGNDLNELLDGFNPETLSRVQKTPGFLSELTLFFKQSSVSNLFDAGVADKISNTLNIIHLLALGKMDRRILQEITADDIYDIKEAFLSCKTSIRALDYMSMDLPNIFGYVSEENSQRSEFIIYTTQVLLKDFEDFISIVERER